MTKEQLIYEGFKLSLEGYNFECYNGEEAPSFEQFVSDNKENIQKILEDSTKNG